MTRRISSWIATRSSANRIGPVLEQSGVEPVILPPRSPNLNSHLERFFGSLKFECLDRLILFGERSLRNACREYVSHYHGERNHHDKQQSSQAEPEKAAFEFGGGAVGAWIRCMACIPSPGASRCGVEKESADSSDPSTSERRYTSSRRGTTPSAIGACGRPRRSKSRSRAGASRSPRL